MEVTASRIAENQSRFREANEKIDAAAESLERTDNVPFLCECPDPRCVDIVRLSLVAYETVRSSPTRFFVQAGHGVTAAPDGEPVAERIFAATGYEVFEKIGRAGQIAAALDPRSDSGADASSSDTAEETT